MQVPWKGKLSEHAPLIPAAPSAKLLSCYASIQPAAAPAPSGSSQQTNIRCIQQHAIHTCVVLTLCNNSLHRVQITGPLGHPSTQCLQPHGHGLASPTGRWGPLWRNGYGHGVLQGRGWGQRAACLFWRTAHSQRRQPHWQEPVCRQRALQARHFIFHFILIPKKRNEMPSGVIFMRSQV